MSDNAALSDVPNEAASPQTVATEDPEPAHESTGAWVGGDIVKRLGARAGAKDPASGGAEARARKPYLILILIPSSN